MTAKRLLALVLVPVVCGFPAGCGGGGESAAPGTSVVSATPPAPPDAPPAPSAPPSPVPPSAPPPAGPTPVAPLPTPDVSPPGAPPTLGVPVEPAPTVPEPTPPLPPPPPPPGFGIVADVAFDPVAALLYAIDARGDLLARAESGVIRVVAPVLHPRVRSLTFRPDPPRLYALTEAGDEIVVIDPVTGHLPTKFRIHGFPVLDAIEWDEVHRELRGVSRADHVLVRVDPLTGETVPLLAIDPAFDLVALAVRPWDGILIGLDVLQNRLVRIDVEQGEIVELAPLAEDQARGLSAGPDGLVVLSRPEEGTETDVLPVADAIDEATLADLAGDLEIELGAFEEPERHRGGGTDAAATLLWPRRDVRPEGLSTYAIEVDDAYGAGGALAHLEFRKGGETLWRDEKPFDPAGAVAIGRVPAEVLRRAGVGDTVTWGLFYDAKARRKDVRADFRLVRDAATEKQLERVARDPELERRVPLARGVLAGLVYQNHGLHSESLVHHVRLAVANPHSLRPLWGIVVALRRLDLTESQLWVTVVEPVLRAPGASTAAARRAPLLDATGLRTLGLYGRAGGTPKSSAAIPAAKPPK